MCAASWANLHTELRVLSHQSMKHCLCIDSLNPKTIKCTGRDAMGGDEGDIKRRPSVVMDCSLRPTPFHTPYL